MLELNTWIKQKQLTVDGGFETRSSRIKLIAAASRVGFTEILEAQTTAAAINDNARPGRLKGDESKH